MSLDPSGSGQLAKANLGELTQGSDLREDLVKRGWRLVTVGVHDEANGIGTVLSIPMWYDSRTSFEGYPGSSFPGTLVEALGHPDWAWDEAGGTDLKFHLEEGVLLIDEVSRPAG